MRFVVVFKYRNMILAEPFDCDNWANAYLQSLRCIPPQAVTIAIYDVRNVLCDKDGGQTLQVNISL